MKYEVVIENQAILGEGPAWDAVHQKLLWIDIIQRTANLYDVNAKQNQKIQLTCQVGSIVPRQTGGYAIATNNSILALSADGKIGEIIAPINITAAEQMNDGKCDARGRYWTGTLALDRQSPVGGLYRVDADHGVQQMLTDVIVSNGMAWNKAADKMYYIDTKTKRIDVFDYDVDQGAISHRRTFVNCAANKGSLDGMTIDAEDGIWVVMWGASVIHRYSPTGKLDAILEFPVERITSCCFGGADLGDLYVTSTRNGLNEEQLKQQPLAGSLFKVRPGVKGTSTVGFSG